MTAEQAGPTGIASEPGAMPVGPGSDALPVGPDADALWSRLQARAGVRVPLPALLGDRGCRRLAPPLASVRVGDGPDVLVVENADPYWALADLLSGSSTAMGLLAWGAGRGFEQPVASLWQHDDSRDVYYAGDLDPDGVAIATSAAARAARDGHAVLPHAGLWRAVAACPPTGAGRHDWSRADGAWLGGLWPATAAVRDVGGRVAQERLTMQDLAAAVG